MATLTGKVCRCSCLDLRTYDDVKYLRRAAQALMLALRHVYFIVPARCSFYVFFPGICTEPEVLNFSSRLMEFVN